MFSQAEGNIKAISVNIYVIYSSELTSKWLGYNEYLNFYNTCKHLKYICIISL